MIIHYSVIYQEANAISVELKKKVSWKEGALVDLMTLDFLD